MNEYSFLRDISHRWLEIQAHQLDVRLVGKYAELLTPKSIPATMHWNGIGRWTNKDPLEFKYSKKRPNSRWPWPFRLYRAPTVVVEWIELYSSTNDLLFRIEVKPFGEYLRPGDTLRFDSDTIAINI